MAVNKYTRADVGSRLNHIFTVGDFFINDGFDYILLGGELVDCLTAMAEHYGKKPVFPTKNSLFRTKLANARSGGAEHSRHMDGIAADFSIPGVSKTELAKQAERLLGDTGGIGVYGGASEHIHLDTRRIAARWWLKTNRSRTPGFGGIPARFKKGDRSPAIMEIQSRLNELGFQAGEVDGIFGEQTLSALIALQKREGLPQNGIFYIEENKSTELFEW